MIRGWLPDWRRWRWLRLTARWLRLAAWAAAWSVVRGGIPMVMRMVQAQGWSIMWHELTDRIARPLLLIVALVWCVGLWYLFGVAPPPLGWSWSSVIFQGPAVVALAFGVGRLIYPSTRRGRVRTRYEPDGLADWDRVRRNASAHAVRLHAVVGRPSLRAQVTPPSAGRVSAVRLARTPVRECGTSVGRTAIGTPWPCRAYVPHEGTIGYVAIPREWKTAQMENNLLDHCGAGLSTQTKPETFLRTGPVRALLGPVYLIDPEETTGHRSSLHWNPVARCADPQIAMENAAGLAAGAPGKKDESGDNNAWFRDRAAVVLRAFLLIADVTGKTMADVYRWSAGTVEAASEAMALMTKHKAQVPAGWREMLLGVLQTKAERTRDGIMLTLAGSVEWMGDPVTAALVEPVDGEPEFDVAKFIRERGTVYMIATDRVFSPVAPLLSAFTHHVVQETDRLLPPGGRLDPPVGFFLDEAFNTIPMPLDKWLADAGGRGRHFAWTGQSRSQLEQRLGRAGARTVWNATTAKVIGGGVSDDDDLRAFSMMTGDRPVWVDGRCRREVVMTPGQVADIPRWHGLLITREIVTLVRFSPSWRRADVLAARFRRRPAPAPLMIEDAPARQAVAA